ncbi:MAG: hypothetical protein AUI36_18055, partial [Cyanobacteria bacterium 13_1_40CM_2_61_4]
TRLQKMLQGPGDFLIGSGHYYVDGIRCTNPRYVTCSNQPGRPECPPLENNHRPYLIYLDVWERHITDVEDDSIREVALVSGADTCTRAKLVWQVRGFELRADEKKESGKEVDCAWVREEWTEIVHHWQAKHRGHLRARARRAAETPSVEPTVVSPASQYRGPTNQLYRVEIHGGTFANAKGPTFKFSRENGSVVLPILNVAGQVLTVGHLGRDSRSSLQVGDWVELVDDDYILQNRAEPLRQVEKVDSGKMRVTVKGQAASTVGQDQEKHPLLRRWDHKQGDPKKGGLDLRDGAAIIKESDDDKFWLTLENGVQVQFRKSEPPNHYRTGDYWLIPARIATGDVQWLRRGGDPEAIGPHGVRHHYAPLAVVLFEQDVLKTHMDCRRKFWSQTDLTYA